MITIFFWFYLKKIHLKKVKEKEEIGEYNYSRFHFRLAMGLSRAIAGCVDVCVYVYFGFVGLLFFLYDTPTYLYIYKVVWAAGTEGKSEFFKKKEANPLQWKSSETLKRRKERKQLTLDQKFILSTVFSLSYSHTCVLAM